MARTQAEAAARGAEALADDLGFLLARANASSLAVGNAALVPFGLKVRPYSVLALAASEYRPSQRQMSELLRLDPSQVVALVDDLQARGLVERTPDPSDRRTNVVVATRDGRSLLRRSQRAVWQAQRELHADLTDGERTLLADLLRRIAFSD